MRQPPCSGCKRPSQKRKAVDVALPEFQHRELTEEDRLYIFRRCTGNFLHYLGEGRTNAEVADALRHSLGISGGGGGPDQPDYWYQGNGLKIWGGWNCMNPRADKPLWAGAATVAMARQVYGIKTPEEFREPTLFDFAQEQPMG